MKFLPLSLCRLYQLPCYAFVVAVATGSSTVVAEDAGAAGSTAGKRLVLEEVFVTAQRRESRISTTGASISALSADQLQERSISNSEDLAILSPSMHVSAFQGETQVYIRGVGYSSVIGGSDSSTALHTDGVYLSRSAAGIPAFLDVDRVEVLRGPQGTLYGRNATGGSVNIISKGPSDEFEFEGRFLLGDYNRSRVFGAAGGPIGEKAGFRIALQKENRDGYTKLIRPVPDPVGLGAPTDDAEDKDDWMGRVTLEMRPTDNFTFTLRGDYYEADDAASVWHYFGPGTGTAPSYQAVVPESIRPAPYSRKIGSDIEHFNKLKIWGIAAEASWDIGEFNLKSITSYRETRPLNRNDLDASPALGVDQLREEDHRQTAQEFQISSPEYDRFNYVVGAYFFEEKNDIRNEYFLDHVEEFVNDVLAAPGMFPNDPLCCLLELNGKTDTSAYAIFGQANIHLTDRLDLVVGGRYSEEERGGENLVRLVDGTAFGFDNVAAFDDTDFDSFTPKVGLNFEATDDVFGYASVSQGFKSGGFNPGSYQNEPFDPEEITSYEAGVKAELYDNTLRLSSSIFFYDYKDLQVQDVEGNNVVIRNAAEAEYKGFELESTWLASESFQLDFSLTWLDAQVTDGALLDPKFPQKGVQDLDGRTVPKAPEWKFAIGGQYTTDVGDNGVLTLRGDYAWQDEIFFTAFNEDLVSEDSYGWAKARVTYAHASGWSVAAFVDNIGDEEVASNIIFNGDIIGSTQTGNLAPPRTYGVEVGFTY